MRAALSVVVMALVVAAPGEEPQRRPTRLSQKVEVRVRSFVRWNARHTTMMQHAIRRSVGSSFSIYVETM